MVSRVPSSAVPQEKYWYLKPKSVPGRPIVMASRFFSLYNRGMEEEAKKRAKSDGTRVFLVLWKAYRALQTDAEASIKRINLCDSDFRVLEALLHKGPLPVNIIGQMVELTTGSITSAIDRLERKWLVVRKHHAVDRRIRIVELTTKGRQLIEKAFAQHEVDMERAVSNLSRAERGMLVDLLKRLGDRDGVART
jgi:MarR family transcriptional regulator, 2-MHQ and catechol-resistance regulon repressor